MRAVFTATNPNIPADGVPDDPAVGGYSFTGGSWTISTGRSTVKFNGLFADVIVLDDVNFPPRHDGIFFDSRAQLRVGGIFLGPMNIRVDFLGPTTTLNSDTFPPMKPSDAWATSFFWAVFNGRRGPRPV
jgi:hypothetical protein